MVKLIKAIETYYNGYRFRSRLEARWAVFFDTLGVKYEYEPEGFELDGGLRYLPDFRVKCWGTRGVIENEPFDLYIEVKGIMTQSDADVIRKFARKECYRQTSDGVYYKSFTCEIPVLIVGNIPERGCSHDSSTNNAYWPMNGIDIYPFNYELIDGDYFAAYPAAHEGKFYLWGDDSSYIDDKDVPDVENAYDFARQARFEYGENR